MLKVYFVLSLRDAALLVRGPAEVGARVLAAAQRVPRGRVVGHQHHQLVAQRAHTPRARMITEQQQAIYDDMAAGAGSVDDGGVHAGPVNGGWHVRVRVAARREGGGHNAVWPRDGLKVKSWAFLCWHEEIVGGHRNAAATIKSLQLASERRLAGGRWSAQAQDEHF